MGVGSTAPTSQAEQDSRQQSTPDRANEEDLSAMAIAPQRSEIGIRRHFTTEGVHPYDEVPGSGATPASPTSGTARWPSSSWASRCPSPGASTPPTSWPRSTSGGPSAPPSGSGRCSQVADRVADTMTAWGIKDGYFVDDEEALVFNDELKYLIIHQKAAFNSPVWFNIGVAGRAAAGECLPAVLTPS